MLVFQTDADGFFAGAVQANESPLEPGVFLIPGGCVSEAPPACGEYEAARLVNGAWAVVPDYAGVSYWMPDRTKGIVRDRGVPLPVGAALTEPPLTLGELKDIKRAEINLARDSEEAAGFDYLGKRLDSDAQAIKRLYGAAMAAQAAIAGGMPAGNFMVTWTCADGTTVDMTYAEAAAVPVTMAQVSGALHVKARTLKQQIDAATTEAQVEAITW